MIWSLFTGVEVKGTPNALSPTTLHNIGLRISSWILCPEWQCIVVLVPAKYVAEITATHTERNLLHVTREADWTKSQHTFQWGVHLHLQEDWQVALYLKRHFTIPSFSLCRDFDHVTETSICTQARQSQIPDSRVWPSSLNLKPRSDLHDWLLGETFKASCQGLIFDQFLKQMLSMLCPGHFHFPSELAWGFYFVKKGVSWFQSHKTPQQVTTMRSWVFVSFAPAEAVKHRVYQGINVYIYITFRKLWL